MDGEKRREKLIQILQENREPVSGTELAARLSVSRQIIVQDIALLRAVNRNILSTNKGYLLYEDRPARKQAIVKVKHDAASMQDELYTIVDYGGAVLDVFVEHDIYGQIAADLVIRNRADVDGFVKKIGENNTKPLNDLTYGIHYHTIEADTEQILEQIREALAAKGYLIN